MATIKTVGVVGAGTMGNGIAQVFAQAGFAVRVHDVAQPPLDRARRHDREEPREVRREGQAAAPPIATRPSAASRSTTDLDALADVDYVVEAVVEERRGASARSSRQPRRARTART